MFHLLMRDATFDPSRLRTLRSGTFAGGPVSEDLAVRVREWCDVEIAYGLTETGPVAVTRPSDADDKRSTTVGRPLPGVEVKAVDFVTGAFHGPEAVGEIAACGPNVMLGDARMPAETRRSFTPEGLVDDVCVIGVPHEIMGELVCACIVPVPNIVRFFDVFPKTGSGTVKRRELERMVVLDHTAIIGSS